MEDFVLTSEQASEMTGFAAYILAKWADEKGEGCILNDRNERRFSLRWIQQIKDALSFGYPRRTPN